MRTRTELEIEARRIEQQARETRSELGAKPLFTFPESSVELNVGSETGSPLVHRMLRHITSIQGHAGPEFRLIEEEFVSDSKGDLSVTMIRLKSAQMEERLALYAPATSGWTRIVYGSGSSRLSNESR